MNYNTLKTELAPIIRNFKRYAPVVAISILLLTQVAAVGFIVTQPTSDGQYSKVSAQDTQEISVFGGDNDGRLYKVLNDGSIQFDVSTPSNGIEGMSLSPNGEIGYASGGGSTFAYYTSNGTLKWQRGIDGEDTTPLPNGEGIYVSSFGEIVLLDANDGSEIRQISSTGAEFIVAGESGDLYAGSVQDEPSEIRKFNQSGEKIWGNDISIETYGLDVSEKSGKVAIRTEVAAFDAELKTFDSETGSLLDTKGNVEGRTDLKFSPDGETIYTYDDNGDILSLNSSDLSTNYVSSGELGSNPPEFSHMAISRNGEYLYFDGANGLEKVYGENGTIERTLISGPTFISIATREFSEPPSEYDPELEIDTRNYIKHGNAAAYEIYYTNPDTGETQLVNGESGLSLNSSNTSVFTVNEDNETLEATEDTSINQREQFTAEYEGLEQSENVTVANQTVENLPILPGITRVGATYSDSNIALILVGTLLGVVATRVSSAFAGIGALQLTLVAGWFVDLVSLGVVLVGLFAALFIGLNLAANIDYAVSR